MKLFIALLVGLFVVPAFGQGARYDNFNVTSNTNVQSGAQSTLFTLPYSRVTVCAYPDDGGTPCANTVPIYSDSAMSQPMANPLKADVHGRFGFWVQAGTYSYSVQDASGKFIGSYSITLGSQTGFAPSVDPTNGYTGDIGQQVAAAIAAHGCATYSIPPGTYSFTHPIKVPHCVSVFGNGEATKLNWHGTGPAIIASDVSAPGQYVQGYLGNFALTGTSATGQVGIYQGGDPACTGSCTANPSTNVGYNYVIRDVIEYYMDNGIVWGNQTYNVEWQNVLLQNNSKYGWYYPATATGGGQVSHFYHSSMSGNTLGAFFVDQPPQVTFSMYGMDIEYNGSQTTPGVVAMQGGTYTCTDCHIESAFGPFVAMGVNNQTVKFVGGVWVLTSSTTTDPYLVSLNGGKSNYSMDGTLVYLLHPVTNLVKETAASPTTTLDVRNLGLYDPSFFLKSVTNKTGAGVYWCLPYDNTNGSGAGSCYDGNIQNGPLMTRASTQNPSNFVPNSAYMSWNGDGASGGVDLYDTFNSTASSLYAFRLNANKGGVSTPLFSVFRDGWANAAGYKVNNVVGFTGEMTGNCTWDINGGITTNVSGCTTGAGGGGGGVPSVNNINTAVTIAGGTGISVTPSGSTITIAATGGGSNPASTGPVGGNWSTTGAYVPGSVVSYGGEAYLSLTTNNNVVPTSSATDWYLIPGTGGGVAPTGPALALGAFNQGTGETPRTLGAIGLSTDSTGSNLSVPGALNSGTLSVVNTNCALTGGSFNGNVCVVTNNNTQNGNGGVTSTLFQDTGAGRNIGPFPGALYNVGWSHAQTHASTATFLTRGLHFMEGDNGNGMNCLTVGDCIYNYHYLNYIGGCGAYSDECIKNMAVINKEMPGFYHGTVSSITDNNAPGGTYPSGAHKVTMLLNGSTSVAGSNIIGDGTYLMGDPTVTGTTACHFNGAPTTWTGLPSAETVGAIPVAGCTGAAIPAINAWGTATIGTDGNMIGDLPDSGSRTTNIPGSQSFVITPGTGSGAFVAPDGTNAWNNFVCLAGGYIENARITAYNASTHTMTANVRNPHNFNVSVLQGPGCAPYQAISIDDDLANSEQASSYIAFGSADGGAHLILANRSFIIRTGDTPETTTSNFHLVPAAEIVANTAPNVFSGNPQLQKEDNGWLPPANTAVWNPHPVNNPAEIFSGYDYTGSYNNSGYASGIFVTGAGGPRVTGAYQVNHFVNGNDYGMYQHFAGIGSGSHWASLPTRLSSGGIFGSLVANDRTPWDNLIYTGDWMPLQTSVNLFNVAGRREVMRKISATAWNSGVTYNINDVARYNGITYSAIAAGAGHQPDVSGTYWALNQQVEYDFSNDGADSVRASSFSVPKTDPGGFTTGQHFGLCMNANPGICFGSTASSIGGISQDGQVNAAVFVETLTTPASSSAACTAGQFTDDANFHYVCVSSNTWKRVALSTF